jgi:hypothetical protein
MLDWRQWTLAGAGSPATAQDRVDLPQMISRAVCHIREPGLAGGRCTALADSKSAMQWPARLLFGFAFGGVAPKGYGGGGRNEALIVRVR